MGWTVEYTDAAQGQMARLDRPVAQRIARFFGERIARWTIPGRREKPCKAGPAGGFIESEITASSATFGMKF